MYRRAGVATTFSPRFLAVLAEAARISRVAGLPLELVHADAFDAEKNERFRAALERLGLDDETPIHYQAGEPAEAILKVQAAAGMDLIIAGALERESVHRNFTGNVARELLRRAPCDLILFVDPSETPKPLGIFFVLLPDFSEPSRRAFHRALDLAELAGAAELSAIHVQTTFAEAKEKVSGSSCSPEQSLEELVHERRESPVELDYHVLRGNTGFNAFEYIQSSKADLLVMPSQIDATGQPVFAPVLDWVIQVIPSNLWVIRA